MLPLSIQRCFKYDLFFITSNTINNSINTTVILFIKKIVAVILYLLQSTWLMKKIGLIRMILIVTSWLSSLVSLYMIFSFLFIYLFISIYLSTYINLTNGIDANIAVGGSRSQELGLTCSIFQQWWLQWPFKLRGNACHVYK